MDSEVFLYLHSFTQLIQFCLDCQAADSFEEASVIDEESIESAEFA